MALIDTVPSEVAESRLEICKQCPNLVTGQICGICYCFMPLKTKLANVQCADTPPKWVEYIKPSQ